MQGAIRLHLGNKLGLICMGEFQFMWLVDPPLYGPPPHGGIAVDLDRLALLMTGAESLRDVIAFPKTQRGSDVMTECPTPVSATQLEELFIQLCPDLPTKQQ